MHDQVNIASGREGRVIRGVPFAFKSCERDKGKPDSIIRMQNGRNGGNIINHALIDIYSACCFTENSSRTSKSMYFETH